MSFYWPLYILSEIYHRPSQIVFTVTTDHAHNVHANGVTRARKYVHGIDSSA